jgi:D-glycero-alpha-D-manno-heptose-7-phosphate kinase
VIITKTPFRISFCGGGTDFPGFYKKYNGQVLSTTIDKYMYILVKKQSGIIEYKYKIHWNKTEFKNHISQIKHPIIKKTLQYFKINYPIEISSYSDIPASTGLGSSSAFAVGLVRALFELEKKKTSKKKIAIIASKIEVDLIKRKIGRQDHYATCYGGLNHISFLKNETVNVRKVILSKENKKKLENSLVILYTNMKRNSEKVLSYQFKPNKNQSKYLLNMKKDVGEFKKVLNKKKINIKEIGKFLTRQWDLKKKINNITNKKIDKMYEKLISLGIYGGKLLGAGQGGFLLVLSNRSVQKKIISNFKSKNFLKVRFDNYGSQLVYRSDNF